MRAVLDVNVIVSALINAEGPPGRVVAAALQRRFVLVVCPVLLAEAGDVVHRRSLRRFFDAEDAEDLLAAVAGVADEAPDPADPPSVGRDPDAAYLVALARGTAAQLVTGDADLLALDLDDLVICTPRAFLKEVQPR
ncbi:MAG TPA: putative toxin-antitoxin system toxin component, PIN family [Acidimicrobiales bacterium]|nr:putative toxin-antitoxin system toxin component, PIN family [Acidimicrobiales bacterium]